MIEISALNNMFLWMKIILGVAFLAAAGALILIAREKMKR